MAQPEATIFGVVVGTAGHIDHGKSSLVRKLTGIDPDRLPEEKDRGLTIDLGFAPMSLDDGELVGIIDVPGHEKFIRNMVAGASGIDIVILVVAADDSVMPQTMEHLDIMTLLGVRRGIIAINKIDLVEADMVDLVQEEVREMISGTFLEDAPMISVSAETGEGVDDLRQLVQTMVRELPPRDGSGVFRLPIQRVFSSRGHGTVVTGVPVSGQVKLDDRLELLPPGKTGRVRGLQAYRVQVEKARAGHSTAINLADVDYRDLHRGMIAATPGFFRATEMVEVSLRALDSLAKPMVHRMPVRFLQGTMEAVGRLYLIDCQTVEAGGEALAQIRLDQPVVVAPGDRFVLRQASPMVTLGGGEVLDRSRWRLKAGKEFIVESMRRKMDALGTPEAFITSVMQEEELEIHEQADLARRAAMTTEDVANSLSSLQQAGVIEPTSDGKWALREGLERGAERVLDALDHAYREDPYRISVKVLEIRDRTRLVDAFLDKVIEDLAAGGKIEKIRGGRILQPGREPEFSDTEQAALTSLREHYQQHLFDPARAEDLASTIGVEISLIEKLQAFLIDRGEVIRIASDVALSAEAIPGAVKKLAQLFESEGAFSASQAKDALGTTRKFAIPLLEYLDKSGWTRRKGDRREIRSEKLDELG
ncbi:MAG: selenocysteine-specific translation elongation factor [Planctomycetota bacterium]|nr:selenocysteine-specific translation elongation factor [Planctomycetota bacterium]